MADAGPAAAIRPAVTTGARTARRVAWRVLVRDMTGVSWVAVPGSSRRQRQLTPLRLPFRPRPVVVRLWPAPVARQGRPRVSALLVDRPPASWESYRLIMRIAVLGPLEVRRDDSA